MAIPPLLIRPKDLPAAPSVNTDAAIPVDNGTAVQRATATQIVNAGRPFASQPEAEAGVSATTGMSPLTTKQAIAAQVPPVVQPYVDLAEAWAESPTNPDPMVPTSKSSKTWAGEAAASAFIAQSRADFALTTAFGAVGVTIDTISYAVPGVVSGATLRARDTNWLYEVLPLGAATFSVAGALGVLVNVRDNDDGYSPLDAWRFLPSNSGADNAAAFKKCLEQSSGRVVIANDLNTFDMDGVVLGVTNKYIDLRLGRAVLNKTGAYAVNAIRFINPASVSVHQGRIEGNDLAAVGIRVENSTNDFMPGGVTFDRTQINGLLQTVDNAASQAAGIFVEGGYQFAIASQTRTTNIGSDPAVVTFPIGRGILFRGQLTTLLFPKMMLFNDVYVENIYPSDDHDGIFGTISDALPDSLSKLASVSVQGGTFINCRKRAVKTQVANSVVQGITVIRDFPSAFPVGKEAQAEIDFQRGGLSVRDVEVIYKTANGTPNIAVITLSAVDGELNSCIVDGLKVQAFAATSINSIIHMGTRGGAAWNTLNVSNISSNDLLSYTQIVLERPEARAAMTTTTRAISISNVSGNGAYVIGMQRAAGVGNNSQIDAVRFDRVKFTTPIKIANLNQVINRSSTTLERVVEISGKMEGDTSFLEGETLRRTYSFAGQGNTALEVARVTMPTNGILHVFATLNSTGSGSGLIVLDAVYSRNAATLREHKISELVSANMGSFAVTLSGDDIIVSKVAGSAGAQTNGPGFVTLETRAFNGLTAIVV